MSDRDRSAEAWQPPKDCDGKEQLAFEAWASGQRYDMHEHPLHYLFLDPRTAAARQGWKAALAYVRAEFGAAAVTDLVDCPICAEPIKPADMCAQDIELGICHAVCLEGAPTVDLNTGEPLDGPVDTFRYDEEGDKPPAHHRV